MRKNSENVFRKGSNMHVGMKCNGSEIFIKKGEDEEGKEVADIVYGLIVPALVGLGFTNEDIEDGFADYLAETGFCDECMDDLCADCKQDEEDPYDNCDAGETGCCECGSLSFLSTED